MDISHVITAVDSHTMGEPTRIVTGGFPIVKGKTMAEKKAYMENHLDHLRRALMHEPRGHSDMFGSILTEPVDPEADVGIVFMDSGGYLNMCGHGSIGASKVVVELGMVPKKEPMTRVVLDSPAGLVQADVEVQNNQVSGVHVTNVPSFLYKEKVPLNIPGLGGITVDISFGGSFFALVDAKTLGLEIKPDQAHQFIDLGLKIRDVINREVEMVHPTLSHIQTVDLVEFYDDHPTHPESDKRNVVIFGQSSVDRSPCGTGTSAKMAALCKKGELGLNEEFVYESIIGTAFKGKLIETTQVGGYEAVVPVISANAYITGFQKFIIDSQDPLKHGFLI